MTLVSPEPRIERDRYERPLVIPPGGGKPVAYTRATTFVDCIEDKYNLQRWQQRMVARGLSLRSDYLLRVVSIGDPGDDRAKKSQLDKLCENAIEVAKGSAGATTGTALHALTELIDRGEELPPLPAGAAASLERYREATADLTALHIERFLVLDTLKIGGTPDRIVKVGTGPKAPIVIADVKTGSIDYGIAKISAQLAVYARSALYDVPTGERSPHGASPVAGLVIHLPAVDDPKDARCDLVWVDLLAGWNDVLLARDVREARRKRYADLTRPWAGAQMPAFERPDRIREALDDMPLAVPDKPDAS